MQEKGCDWCDHGRYCWFNEEALAYLVSGSRVLNVGFDSGSKGRLVSRLSNRIKV